MAWQNPVLLLALLVFMWAAWRLVCWMGSGGRLPLRGRRGAGSGFANAAMAVQALYHPSARHVVEMTAQLEDQREDDEDGDPPVAGTSAS